MVEAFRKDLYGQEKSFNGKKDTIIDNFSEALIIRIKELQDVILANHQTTTWKKKIDAYGEENWKTFIYNWKCLACQHQTKVKGTIFFDILPANDNQNMIEFRLGNRTGKRNCLEETLTILGLHDKIENITKNCWTCIYKVPSNSEEISEKAKELMQEINLKIK